MLNPAPIILREMNKRYMTRQDLAGAAGLGPSTMRMLLSMKDPCWKLSTLEKIAKVFDMKVSELIIETEKIPGILESDSCD